MPAIRQVQLVAAFVLTQSRSFLVHDAISHSRRHFAVLLTVTQTNIETVFTVNPKAIQTEIARNQLQAAQEAL